MRRGVVVELNDDSVTVLTPEGQFLKTKVDKANYKLGEEIPFLTVIDEREEAVTRSGRRKSFFTFQTLKFSAISAFAIILIFFTLGSIFKEEEVYAYMTVDINPSFEMAVNKKLEVISLKGMNEDGKAMIDDLKNWEKKPVKEVVRVIVHKSEEKGYVYSGKEIFLTTVYNDKNQQKKTELRKGIKQIQTSFKENDVIVKTEETDIDTRKKALDQGISTGQYLKIQSMNKQAEEIKKVKEDDHEVKHDTDQEEAQTEQQIKVKTDTKHQSSDHSSHNQVKNTLQEETKPKLEEVQKKLKEHNQADRVYKEQVQQREKWQNEQREKQLKEQQEQAKQREKEREEQAKRIEEQQQEQAKQKEKQREEQAKRIEKQQQEQAKQREKEREEQMKQQEEEQKEQEKQREKEQKEREKQQQKLKKEDDHDDDDDHHDHDDD